MSPSEVLAELKSGLAYTTVMTTLARLHRKGALTRERRGRAYAYALAGSMDTVAAGLTARRMLRLLDAGEADRSSVLASFVADLDPADERLLLSLLVADPHTPPAG